MKGRKPIPAMIRLLRGNPGKRPIPNEPKFAPGARCPAWLDKHARRVWDRCASELESRGMLAAVYGEILADYCLAHSMVRRMARLMNSRSLAPEDRAKVSREMRDWSNHRKVLGVEFGFTPSASMRLAVPAKAKDELGEFLERKATA